MDTAVAQPDTAVPRRATKPLHEAAWTFCRRLISSDFSSDWAWATPVITVVGRFLHGHSLAATPINYRVAHRYLIDRDPALTKAIDIWLTRHGRLDDASMSAFGHEEEAQVKSEIVGQMAAQIQQQLVKATTLIGRSNDDVRSFGKALDNAVASIGSSTEPAELSRHLLKITRTMITKSQRVEERLAKMADQIETLQRDLDAARRDAALDPLTGMLNRKALLQRLNSAIASAEVNHTTICLAFCDIDHFKRINDTHGHQVGDRVLQFVARQMAKACHGDTTLGRYGGEEFVILFEHASIDSAAEMVDTIRRNVSRRHLVDRVNGETIGSISFSAGISKHIVGEGPEALIDRADRALYRAKSFGRDRVELCLTHTSD